MDIMDNIALTKDGKDAIAYTGEMPWHKKGQRCEKAMTAEEALTLSGMRDAVKEERRISVDGGLDGSEYKAIVRKDTERVLAVVRDSYTIIQDAEAFSFMDSLIGQGHAAYQVAGMLDEGRKTWMLVKTPGTILVNGTDGDKIEKYLLLSNSHDGSAALRVFFTPIRVVCQNTLTMAFSENFKRVNKGVAIRHTINYEAKMDNAARLLGIVHKAYDDFGAAVNKLAAVKINAAQFEKYVEEVIPGDSTRAENQRAEVVTRYHEGLGSDIDGVNGSLWGAYNAVTEYVDHERGTRGTDEDERLNNRLRSIWLGSGAQMKAKALDKALALANA
jgi:phage/plasmid-like protein (TIGR03299 family)